MQITEQNGIFTATHVTGPIHNMLRLTVDRGQPQDFTVTVLPPVGECRHHDGLTAENVKPKIQAGLAEANADLKSDYVVRSAEIIENDSGQSGIFEYLTHKIVEAAAANQRN